jgi:MFS family permease
MVADRTNKHLFLAATAIVGAAVFFLCPWFQDPLPLMIVTFFAGGVISTTYPVGMAILGDDIAEEYVTQGAAYMSVGFSLGAITGPYFLSVMMDRFDYRYLFFSVSAALIVYGAATGVSFIRGGGGRHADPPEHTAP